MRKIVFILTIVFTLFFTTTNVFAISEGQLCNPNDANIAGNHGCDKGLSCVATPGKANEGSCQTGGTINIAPPDKGFKSISNAIGNFITIALAVAIILVLVMLIIGAYEWITSGGDKEAVAKARNRIINALIGLVVLAVAFALARLGGQIVGFDINNIVLPGPAASVPPGQV
ncbi:hypothetical protein HYS95_03220 [Candidatus Daviesbacteria bacterium]|nr:hypothetical protein [Candidatus Daviesbacteria bacterium]